VKKPLTYEEEKEWGSFKLRCDYMRVQCMNFSLCLLRCKYMDDSSPPVYCIKKEDCPLLKKEVV
jgi:hypothetical protein